MPRKKPLTNDEIKTLSRQFIYGRLKLGRETRVGTLVYDFITENKAQRDLDRYLRNFGDVLEEMYHERRIELNGRSVYPIN